MDPHLLIPAGSLQDPPALASNAKMRSSFQKWLLSFVETDPKSELTLICSLVERFSIIPPFFWCQIICHEGEDALLLNIIIRSKKKRANAFAN